MGAISPVPFADEAFMSKVEANIIKPTFSALNKEKMAITNTGTERVFIFFI